MKNLRSQLKPEILFVELFSYVGNTYAYIFIFYFVFTIVLPHTNIHTHIDIPKLHVPLLIILSRIVETVRSLRLLLSVSGPLPVRVAVFSTVFGRLLTASDRAVQYGY